MTASRHRRPGRARRRRLGLHLAGVPRQSRTDLGLLATTLAVVLLTIALADATPRFLTRTADDAIRIAVAEARPSTDLSVDAPFEEDFYVDRVLSAGARASVIEVAGRVDAALPPVVARVVGPPVVTVRSVPLTIALPDGTPGATVRVAHTWSADASGVTWVEGAAPAATVTVEDVAADPGAPSWPVEVGVSEAVATLLDVGPGDTIGAQDDSRQDVPLTVSGVFRAVDPDDAVWSRVPEMLEPHQYGSGPAQRTEAAVYLSAESLPAARVTLEPAQVTRTLTFPVDPSAVDLATLDELAASVAAAEAAPSSLDVAGPHPSVRTQLDRVLVETDARIDAAGSQASVLLAGVVAAGALVLVLTAELLTRRRAVALARSRARGASLAAIGVQLTVESATVATLGAALGLLLASVVAPGPVAWPWPVPSLAVAAVAPPLLGMRAAALATGGRRVPADRHQRRLAARARVVRRVALEASLVLVAVAALLTLRRRGAVGLGGSADLVLAAAPALVAAAGGLVLLRLVPPVLRGALAASRRAKGMTPLVATARAQAAGAPLAVVALVVATSLVTFGAALAQTVRVGQVEGSWDSVGADVVVSTAPGDALADAAASLASADGVEAVALLRVADGVQLFGGGDVDRVRVLAVEPTTFARLLAATPFDAPSAGLGTASDGAPAALVDGELTRSGEDLALLWDGSSVALDPVGTAPTLPSGPSATDDGAATDADGPPPTVVVDRDALAEAVGAPVPPNAVWVVGTGADAAVSSAVETAGLADATVTSRSAWLAERRDEPLTAGLMTLAVACLVVLLALTALSALLGASSGAPERATALATLRVLGVDRRGATRVAVGELLPTAVVACVTGVGLGALLAALVSGPLALRLVTGQAGDPALVLPWWAAAPALVVLTTVLAVVAVESSLRRRERLGQVLRVG
ncbi:FtsX-like permease family protein [Actinotalea subterranea]|uniref:FtsX-like permease family protein n=1 Tax=Actinotalea subterranea TaxID=2607497 RepID=UPI0011EEA65A|nr:FtsX-like permease family protein [Actinotalea subterranea]